MPLSLEEPPQVGAHCLRRARAGRPWWAAALAIAARSLLAALGQASAGCGAAGADRSLRVPPIIWWTREASSAREVRSFLPPLYRQVQDDEGRSRSLSVLWPLYSFSRSSEPSGAGTEYYDLRLSVLGPVFSMRSDNYGEGRLRVQFLWPLGSWFRGETSSRGETRKVRAFRFLPIVHYERSWRREPFSRGMSLRLEESPGAPSGARLDERVHLRFLHVAFGYDAEAETGTRRCFVLGGAPAAEDGTHATFGAMAFERGPGEDSEHQLFWRALLIKRWGSRQGIPSGGDRPSDLWRALGRAFRGPPRTLVRLGPVASWESDREADRSRLSLVAGLFSMEREGSFYRGRVLWLVPWRSGAR